MSRAKLKVSAGSQRGTVWRLAEGKSVDVGRDEGCRIVLDDDQASRRHAEFAYGSGSLTVKDLGSTNHTFVNGEKTDRAVLRSGDVVRIGSTEIQVALPGALAAHSEPGEASPGPGPKKAGRRSGRGGRAGEKRRSKAASPTGKAATSGSPLLRLVLIALLFVAVGFVVIVALGGEGRSGSAANRSASTESEPEPEPATPAVEVGLEELSVDMQQAYDQGLTLLEYGNLVRARAELQQVVQRYPGFTEGRRALDRTTAAIDKRVDTAFERARAAIDAARTDDARRAIDDILFLLPPGDPRRDEATALADGLR